MLLHGEFSGPFLLAWDLDPLLTFLLVLAAGLYGIGLRRIARTSTRQVPDRYPVYFALGLIALAVALLGPLDAYNENSFALHMSQHVALMLVAAPLLLLGRPMHIALWAVSPDRSGVLIRPVLRRRWVRGSLNTLTHPLVALLLINVNLVAWHLPGLYVAALESDLIHELEHILFTATALLLWWIIIDPIPRHHRTRPEHGIALLFVTGTVGNLLSLYFIFAPEVIYSYYLTSEPIWRMSQLADQRAGGLIMLIAGVIVFYGATFLLIIRNVAGSRTEVEETTSALPVHD